MTMLVIFDRMTIYIAFEATYAPLLRAPGYRSLAR